MICIQCNLSFSEHVKVCPKCNGDTVVDRRQKNRRVKQAGMTCEERRSSDRRKQLIKKFDEVFWKGNAKYC